MKAESGNITLNQAVNVLLRRKAFENIPKAMLQKWLLILRALASHINSQSRLCTPAQETLAIECAFSSRKSIQRHLNEMKKSGVIDWKHIERRGSDGKGNTKRRPNNSYEFHRLFEMAGNPASDYKFRFTKTENEVER